MSKNEQELSDIYYEKMMEEPVGLKQFMQQVSEGVYGSFSSQQKLDFLQKMEQVYIENIHLKTQEIPELQEEVEERIEETHRFIQELIEKYAQ